mgnify:FL=1
MKKVALLCVSLFLVACESKQEAQTQQQQKQKTERNFGRMADVETKLEELFASLKLSMDVKKDKGNDTLTYTTKTAGVLLIGDPIVGATVFIGGSQSDLENLKSTALMMATVKTLCNPTEEEGSRVLQEAIKVLKGELKTSAFNTQKCSIHIGINKELGALGVNISPR